MLSTKVKKIVQHAYQTVPFYMNKAGGKSVNLDEWLELPITQKNDLVQKNDSFISANYLADMLQNKLLHAHTSGTTGKCADIFWSMSECKRSLLPLWMARRTYYNIVPGDKYCYFYSARRIGEADVEFEESETSLGFCKSNLNEQKLINIWNRMKEYKPVWINAQPSELFLLCKTIEKNNLDMIPTLRYVESTGEMLFPHVRRYIEDILGLHVVNQYGCYEMNSIAYECPCGNLHCFETNVKVEILDAENRELEEGMEGEICVTTLNNFVMPLIRYKVGDYGRIVPGTCKCGAKGKIIELTSGRSNDFVTDCEGNKLSAFIFVRCVENVNRMYEHAILQFQVVQSDINEFQVILVVDEEFEFNEIADCFMNNLWQDTLRDAQFKFYFSEELLPDDTGKLKWFINKCV
jgi:phenylacetate-CoA ligase